MKIKKIDDVFKILTVLIGVFLITSPLSLTFAGIAETNDDADNGDNLSRSSWPPAHKNTSFLPRVNVVHLDSESESHANFFSSIPMTIFHHDTKVYQSLLTTDMLDDQPTDFINEDWNSYLNQWDGAAHVNFIGNVSTDSKNEFLLRYDLSWEEASNITGDPIAIANEIADHDWRDSETVVIAPYLTSPTMNEYLSMANAAVIASLNNAPLLLTDTASLNSETISLIQKLDASKAILVELDDVISNNVNSQLMANAVSIENDLTTENLIVDYIRSQTEISTLCAVLLDEQTLPAALSGARYAGFVLQLPDTIRTRSNELRDILENANQPLMKQDDPEPLPREFKDGETTLAQNFYTWLEGVGGNDDEQLETVITFNTQPYYDSTNGFDVYFDRAISGDPSNLMDYGAVSGRMPLDEIGNIALSNRGNMYRSIIFSNPRPNHITLAMNAYEVEHSINGGLDKWGGNHIVNEVFGHPYRGWCSENNNFPWTDIQNNTPDLSPILPPGDGDGPDSDPGQFASFNESYETHFHSGAYEGTGSHPVQPGVDNIGFVNDINSGSAFLYFSCHGGGSSIAVRETDNGVAQDPSDMVSWGDDYWPATDGRVYDGSNYGSYNQNDLDNDLENVHGSITAYNACVMANGKMNEILLEHGGTASFGSYTSVSFDGSGWWWNVFVHLITHHDYTLGEAACFSTAKISELYCPGADNSGMVDDTLQYVVYGDPNVHFVQSEWDSPEPLEINVDYGGHKPDKPPFYFNVSITPDTIPVNTTTQVQINVTDLDTTMPLIANVTLSSWGIQEEGQTNGAGMVTFDLMPPYGEVIEVLIEKEDYDTYEGEIQVIGGSSLSGMMNISIPSLGIEGVATQGVPALITATSTESVFDLRVTGCGVDAVQSTVNGTALLEITPTNQGLLEAVITKDGYNISSVLFTVSLLHLNIDYTPNSLVVGHQNNLITNVTCQESGQPIEGAEINIFGNGMNTTLLSNSTGTVIFTETPASDGNALITAQKTGFEDVQVSIPIEKGTMSVTTIDHVWVNYNNEIDVYVNDTFDGSGIDNATVSVYGAGIGIDLYTESGSLADGEHLWFDVDVGSEATYLSGDLIWEGSSDIDMKLYNPSGTQVDSSVTSSPGEFVDATNPVEGTWQIEVYSYSGATSSFSLDIAVEYGSGVSGSTDNGFVSLFIEPTSIGTITVQATKTGFEDAFTTISVTEEPGYFINLYAGWNCITLPFNQSMDMDNTSILIKYGENEYNWSEAWNMGLLEASVFLFNATSQAYEYMMGDNVVLDPGVGYWIYSYDSCVLWIDEISVPDWNNMINSMSVGWNNIGVPLYQTRLLSDLIIESETVDYTWSEAWSLGLVEPSVFYFDALSQQYDYLIGDTAEMQPGMGYWFYAYDEIILKMEND